MSARFTTTPLHLMLIAATVIVAGSVARLYDTERMVVWHDEVFSLLRSFGFEAEHVRAQVFAGQDLQPSDLLAYQRPDPALGLRDTLASLMTHPEHSPLYFLAARLATPAFPSPLTGMRGTGALLGLLLVPAVFWLGRELFEDSKAAWIAAALAACSPMHLLYAQEARQYALWTVLAAAASASLLRALRKGNWRNWALYTCLVAVGLYSHLLFGLVLAAHAAYLVLCARCYNQHLLARFRGWGASIAAAALLFSPWIAVLLTQTHRVEQVTAWMERPVPVERLLDSWGTSLVRTFADFPTAGPLLLLGLLPLAWALWHFCARAPWTARLFLCLLFLAFASAVLVPDLIQGGSRSLHPRYLLPAFVAVELAVAYVLATGWEASSRATRFALRSALFLLLGVGIWSSGLILRADTWWSKNFSARNREVAELVNSTERPLLVVNDSGVGLGEAISLARYLADRVVIRGEPRNGGGVPIAGFSDVFLVTPSAEQRAALAADYVLVPVIGTWQWFRAVPSAQATDA